jgi:Na+-translocating ferredoxin:NAD+ oxidoreductase RNF subunit RnfB
MYTPSDDELIDALEAELPASNCGGCGFSGCRSFAEIVAGSGTTHGFLCTVGGHEVMDRLHVLLRNHHG